jgi:putative Mn2+ efflux pump MntP
VDWVVLVVLLALAAVLAAQGARLVAAGRRAADADEEAGTDRAVWSLVLLAVALGVGAAGAAVAAAGSAGPVQVAVFLAAVAAVVLPAAGVLLGARRRGRPRRVPRR